MNIPIRNIWWLLLYSSEYMESNYSSMVGFEELPEDIPDLIGKILTNSVESRLRRQLTFSFEKKEKVINRVRGKINHVITARKALLSKGKIFCSFDELTINNLRNRYVKAALIKISKIIKNKALRKKCISLANFLTVKGVSSIVPKFKELKSERFGRNDICDREMISAAKLAMDLCLPNERNGDYEISDPEKPDYWLRKLFEKAIGNFYIYHLLKKQWKVSTGKKFKWEISYSTAGFDEIFPGMKTDIILDNKLSKDRIIIDTKFKKIFQKTPFKEKSLVSENIYQLYTYLHSQQHINKESKLLSGLLLYPSFGDNVDEHAFIQGYKMRFSTVDLTKSHVEIKKRLLFLIS
ncbi:5-methylcytosine-specific restriction endonuclease system specificity protein McrC [Prochlorococcus marinus str. XMU1401]|uniref:5-methylcytosine-specific restriction endonuclease system specificity protein McrC n=1 Tax=Prochlorococcus marinus str. XMU1401 TaxID=2052594 RepID=A0A8I1X0N2_PROMR|nr:5-methylcytosine-specific restriction endonuclease system specificity protein McrC [Prochlorococcus marinus]MBO8223075.1 5-methylcytosine-specific restriction endonuclease system specificity protein McrC [Prochlorococcus marinus str. XMU1401]MBW3059619.1 5-methylcytosine-specific restriction endonuclease system specificity protein McrC [Prochlorococcus marinus str. XMU1401E]